MTILEESMDRPPSRLATPSETREADMMDTQKIHDGLESRTACCLRLVPTDCINATCGHGQHQHENGTMIEDASCILLLPGPLLQHPQCPSPRTVNQAILEADEEWEEAARQMPEAPR